MELFDYEQENLSRLHTHLAECTVLLKKDGHFPLAAPGKIAAYGAGVRGTIKGGTGSGEVNSRFFINVEQGLKDAGFTVTTDKWLDAYDALKAAGKEAFAKELRVKAKAAKTNFFFYALGAVMPEPEYELPLDGEGDTAIYVVARISGEGTDRTPEDTRLTATEIRDILALNEKYANFMLVLNVGGVVDLAPVKDVGNILVLSQLGVETGTALAQILLGIQNPSGALATSWASCDEYCPAGDFGDPDDTHYEEGIFVGYRYFDSVGKRAQYPFGYGLSYSEFSVAPAGVSVSGSTVFLKADVTNVGAYPGKQIVQLYLSAPAGRLPKAYQELAAFAKTEVLQPGQAQQVELTFDLRDFASFDENANAYILEAGNYILRVGKSSIGTTAAAELNLPETVTVQTLKPMAQKPAFADWQPDKTLREDVHCDEVILLEAAALTRENPNYDFAEPIEDIVKTFTDEELIYSNIGAFDPKAGVASVIGQASPHVAGAAGETTSKLVSYGEEPLVMADGPAGVRLSQKFYRDSKGAHPIGLNQILQGMLDYLPKVVVLGAKLVMGGRAPRGVMTEYQYASAIPIGTALAQSFNVDFGRTCGDIVGSEMQCFGVHLWLAPALNIHRSIRCGRNFEYYSEDPVVSGLMAAALTEGVQSHPGCGVTIKHYCANNQETNRYGSNSHISIRALREIYLKGFGICVRKAQPKAVMTSYNLLNGVHTAQSRELIHDILRAEFGFDGLVMTDWVIGGGVMNRKDDIHPAVQAWAVAQAGGELFMPGCKADFENMKKALHEGKLTRHQLEINASRLYRMCKWFHK